MVSVGQGSRYRLAEFSAQVSPDCNQRVGWSCESHPRLRILSANVVVNRIQFLSAL